MKEKNPSTQQHSNHWGSVVKRAVIVIACDKSWSHSAMTKAFRLREHLGFKDMQGNELLAIQEKVMRIKDTYSIYRKGNEFATVKKVLITPLRQRFDVHVAGAENMEVEGNILNHEYEIHEGRKLMAEVSKKWFHEDDTYGVNVIPGANDILILAITVIIDMMID